VRLVHGDGLLDRDWAYASFRAVVRNRLAVAVAKSLHPEFLFKFSSWLSGKSRSATREEARSIEQKVARWLSAHPDPDWDLLIIGHLHHPLLSEFGGRRLACLGGWLDRLGYGLLQGAEFRLLDFDRDRRPELSRRRTDVNNSS
jgi:UDP-2,3-diacylglucosamine pyrophosphatase LpxH